jgi:two-component system, NarL family, response regulator DevR
MSSNSASVRGQAFSKLGQQEKQVLFLLSSDRTDQDVAKALFLGEGSIRNYVNSILSKLGLATRAEAITCAAKHNLKGHLEYND